ncbi:ATP-binding protein [Verrucomicrobiota bacterium]
MTATLAEGLPPVYEQLKAATAQLVSVDRLLHENETFRMLVEQSNYIAYSMNATGVLEYVGPQVRSYGFEPEDLISQNILDIVFDDDRARIAANLGRTFVQGEEFVDTFRVQAKDGRIVWFEDHGKLLCDDEGTPVGLIGFVRDITEEREVREREVDLKEKLARAKRMQSLGVMAGGVAHDLNNLIGPMVALTDFLSDDLDRLPADVDVDIADMKESLELIRTSAKRASMTIRDLVEISRRNEVEFAAVDMNAIIADFTGSVEMAEARSRYPRVAVNTMLAASAMVVSGSEGHLIRAISNTVRNGVEAIEGSGAVTITTRRTELDAPMSAYEVIEPGGYIVVTVSDTGGGICAEHLERIFEPFFTRKKQSDRSGSGLGLSVVHGIVKDHKGFIDVESRAGKGTTFTLYLPAAAETVTEPITAADTGIEGGTERVLVVDDEPGQRGCFKTVLRRHGYDVTLASNGWEALRLFEDARDAGEDSPFHLVLLDMVMEGVDGLATYEQILEMYPEQKVIGVSGCVPGERGEVLQRLGAGWIDKPYEARDLLKAVRRRLDMDPEDTGREPGECPTC